MFLQVVMKQKDLATSAPAPEPSAAGAAPIRMVIFQSLMDDHPMSQDLGNLPTMESPSFLDAGRYGGAGELLLGPAGSGAHPHAHPAAFNALIRGKKRWFMWPPHCTNYGWAWGTSVLKWLKEYLPTLKNGTNRCTPTQFDQHAGQVVFVPHSWGHAVLNLEPTLAISRQMGLFRGYADVDGANAVVAGSPHSNEL